jgi:HK97 family phage prohead protease
MSKTRAMEYKRSPVFVTKIDEAQGIVEAIVSVTGICDHGDDIIQSGAYAKTIVERGRKVRVLDAHNSWSIFDVIGKVMALREIGRDELPPEVLEQFPEATGGLWTQTQYLLDTPEGKGAFVRISTKAIDEYSIGYNAMQYEIRKMPTAQGEKTVRLIKEVKLWEYSAVLWGMNPATATVGAKREEGGEGSAWDPETLISTAAEVISAEQKAGRTLSAANASKITAAFQALKEVLEAAGLTVDTAANVEEDEEGSKAASVPRVEPEASTHPQGNATQPAAAKMALERDRLTRLIELGLAM